MTTSEVTQDGVRTGFQIKDISSGRVGAVAQAGGPSGPRIGKYTVNQADLDEIGAKSIEDAKQNADIIVIDEVGPMELTSNAFVNAVESAPGSTKPMVLTLHYRASHPLLERIRKEVPERLVMVTLENRATLASEIEGVILRTIPVRKE